MHLCLLPAAKWLCHLLHHGNGVALEERVCPQPVVPPVTIYNIVFLHPDGITFHFDEYAVVDIGGVF